MTERASRFPEKTILRLSAGTLDRIHAVAEEQETSAAEFMRRAIRLALGRDDQPQNDQRQSEMPNPS